MINAKKINTKDKIIRSGIEYMTKYGYLSSNLDNILKSISIPKGSFYYYFKSKESFGLEVLDTYSNFFNQKLDFHLDNESASCEYLDRIFSFYKDAKNGLIKYNFERGCLIGGLLQEESLLPVSYIPLLQNILLNWQNKMAACLKKAQINGEVNININVDEAAYFFWTAWEGAIARCRLEKNTKPLDNFIKLFLIMIKNN